LLFAALSLLFSHHLINDSLVYYQTHIPLNSSLLSYPETGLPQHASLIELFTKLLRELDSKLANSTNNISHLKKPFTIQSLYKTCCDIDPAFTQLSYRQFRTLLYDNPTNEILSRLGGQFVIAENNGHVDRNLYRLELKSESD